MHPDPDPSPPTAAARPHALRHGDDERVDPWFWLGQRDDAEVLAYLEAENDYTTAATAHLAALRGRIYDEIVGRVQETDASSPAPKGPYEYFTRTVEGRQYAIHCRRPRVGAGTGASVLPDPFAAPGAAEGEVIVLDENHLATGHDYFAVGDLVLCPDQRVVALSTDVTGGERYTLRFRTIADRDSTGTGIGTGGTMLDDVVPDVYYGVAWADDRTVLYTRPDDAMRPWQVWRHTLGTPAADDALVFQEDDDRFYVSVGRTSTGRYLVITSASKVTSEVWLVPTADPSAPPVVVEPRAQGHEYHVEHHEGPAGDRLYVLTNGGTGAGAENFALMVTSTATPGRAHWQPVIAARPDVRLDDVDAFARHLVISQRGGGLEQLRVLRLADDGAVADDHLVEMPDAVYSAWTGSNLEYDTDVLRYQYMSLVAPASAFDFDVTTRTSTLVKRQTVPGYDPSRYESRRLWATAADGTQVPISIVWRPDARRDAGPLLLYGYGSYEVSIDPTFSVGRVSLLDRGVAFAIAHIRGGGEMGRAWYDDGKLLHKRNTFTDFVACADHLVAEGWSTPDQLAIRGGSAGGLLMGAVTNLRPELFRVVVAEVPFVDCLTTILDESLPLTVTEWEEWGDPVHDPAVYDYMKSYSPYDNVVPAAYPAMLVTGGLNDPRVQYWEPAKWVAKLRTVRTDDRLLILKMEMGAGHGGPSGRYEAWRDEAFVLAFVLDQLGLAGS